MQTSVIALFFLIIVGGETGVVKRQGSDNLTINDELANHTTAIIETVLQNIHRMKNFEERDRLERLVTRFKILVQELELNAPSALDGATDLKQNEEALDGNRFFSKDNRKNEEIFQDGRINEVNPKGQYSNKLLDFYLKSNSKKMDSYSYSDPETASFHRLNNKTMTTTAKPSLASPVLPNQGPTESTKGNSSIEEDEDADDELVQELHEKIIDSNPVNPPKRTDESLPRDELITVAERRRMQSEDDQIDDDFDSTEDDDLEMNDQQLQDDLKLLNKVIGKLREVKALLRRLRAQGISRR